MSGRRGAANSKTVMVSKSALSSEKNEVRGQRPTKRFQAEAHPRKKEGAVAELSSHLGFANTQSCHDNRRYLGVQGAYTQGSAGGVLLGSMRRMLRASPFSGH